MQIYNQEGKNKVINNNQTSKKNLSTVNHKYLQKIVIKNVGKKNIFTDKIHEKMSQ